MIASIADWTMAVSDDSSPARRLRARIVRVGFRRVTPEVYPIAHADISRRAGPHGSRMLAEFPPGAQESRPLWLTQIKPRRSRPRENPSVQTAPKESLERAQPRNHAITLREKVSHLSRPESYPEKPAVVEVVQTHMSCVFLTGQHAWKLKKPVRHDFLDFSTLEARRADCEEELRLNRRLAPDVYLEVVPLAVTPQGVLRLGGDGVPVEWLVKMRRLPSQLMLDDAIRRGNVTRQDIRRLTLVLADFFRHAGPVALDAAQYRKRLERDIRANHEGLSPPEYSMPAALVQSITASQLAFLAREAPLLEARVAQRRIVEGHGDLRPEHVCLGPEPLFIDCLEFSRDWRVLDPADELAYLAMECEHAGAPWIGEVVFETYREATGDDPPAALVRFYKAYRATVRARLSAWHLKDNPDPADQGKWVARAQRYLELADRYSASATYSSALSRCPA
jgi:aminoglycoside phosphotransferase family enzyme